MVRFLLLSVGLTVGMLACTRPAQPRQADMTKENDSSRPTIATASGIGLSKPAIARVITDGYVQEFDRRALPAIHIACTAEVGRVLNYEVSLSESGAVLRIRLKKGTGKIDCDEAILNALTRSKWKGCLEQNQPIACTFNGSFALPSSVHRRAAQ
jgi:hypothetical protein